jgi:hypothetical membrane protein
VLLKIIGSKNKARQNRIMNFGIISESLFNPGVIARAIATTEKINDFAKELFTLIRI